MSLIVMGISFNLLYVLLLFFLVKDTSLAIVPNISTDEVALVAFKSRISFHPNNILTRNWSSSTPICSWIGITCGSRHRRVTELDLSSMQLHGTIPSHLGNLSFLVYLDISNNTFHGDFPNELSHLQRLKVISVGRNNFTGTIPSFLSLLPNLRSVYLYQNQFSGKIPSSLSNLTKLEKLVLYNNFLDGEIPQELGDVRSMTLLELEFNRLTGSIPPSIFNITTMRIIALSQNKLTGKLPTTICDHLPNLEGFYLTDNHLGGVIPPNIQKCRNLQVLVLSINEFIGTIPRELGNLWKLQMLDLSSNELNGTIPRELGNLTNLEELYLFDMHLEGNVPRELGNLTDLEELNLDTGHLEGEVPSELGNLKKLTDLALSFNDLTGSFPISIFNLSALYRLRFLYNKLSGTLPSDIGRGMPNLEIFLCGMNNLRGFISPSISNSSRLRKLDLSYNSFTGPIPESLGNLEYLEYLSLDNNNFISDSTLRFLTSLTNCKKLKVLTFSGNLLDGVFPASVGNFSNSLQYFEAENSKLKGVIPEEIGNLTRVIRFLLSKNELSGHIPKTVQGMFNLQELYLKANKLDGTIPDVICNLKKIGALILSDNQFSGSVPPCLGNVRTLRKLYLDQNLLNFGLPTSLGGLLDLIEFDVSSNSLSGNIPLEIGNLKSAILIDLSKNDFSGMIPTTLGGQDRLINLSLAHNRLHGSIPDSFGKMQSLEILDLSFNNLSGEIPKSLEALVYLKNLNISFNRLSGEIPSGGPFKNVTSQSFLSNDALCGDFRFNVKPCVTKSRKNSRRTRVLVGVFALLGIGSLFALVVGYVMLRLRKTKNHTSQAWSKKEHLRISYYELERATEGFSESNLLGNGSLSKVYKGILNDGTLLAAKVFNVQLEDAFKSFDTECEILRNLHHRNLTKVITSCANLDFKALVLEYMPNGTLEKWLYSHNLFLNLLQRLDIMIDIASAIDYLHNGYSTPVVHCDLKPSNVLLDQELVGHVSDFGIAKLLGEGEAFVQTRTFATIGYIAPEYGQDGIVSTRCDTYSFGIIMMETFTRMRPSDELFTGELSIRRWVGDFVPGGIHEVVDANLVHLGDEQFDQKMQCLTSIMELSLSCTLVSPDERITMKDALAALTKIRIQFVNN